ncbi:Sortase A [Nocardioides sp. AX2bis]|nr:Sortase A [Nocardioides sp. AX2bis]
MLAPLVALAALTGCSAAPEREPAAERVQDAAARVPASTQAPQPQPSSPAPEAAAEAGQRLEPAGPATSDGTPRAATLSVPDLGLRDFPVQAYRGTTDDVAGTVIQDAGDLASPYGPDGGVGPGGVGNYLVTGHRLSSTEPFLELPSLVRGDRVTVTADGTDYVYEVRTTRETSFREPASLTAQRAAVPGRPGAEPTRAMITLSTCATPEDHAEGNYWSDENGNPEHRIDKIGVLVASRPA